VKTDLESASLTVKDGDAEQTFARSDVSDTHFVPRRDLLRRSSNRYESRVHTDAFDSAFNP